MFIGAGSVRFWDTGCDKDRHTLCTRGETSVVAKYRFHLSVLTPQSVEYGTYESNSTAAASLPLVSWTGSPPGPELRMERNNTTLPDSTCPGLEEYDALSPVTAWSCNELVLGVYYDGDLHGCPWIVSSYVESASTMDQRFGAGIFIGPTKVSSDCPTESLAPYDVPGMKIMLYITKSSGCSQQVVLLSKHCPLS